MAAVFRVDAFIKANKFWSWESDPVTGQANKPLCHVIAPQDSYDAWPGIHLRCLPVDTGVLPALTFIAPVLAMVVSLES